MNKRLSAVFALLAAVLLATPLLAQTQPTLETLKSTYEKAKKDIDTAFDQQKTAAVAAYGKAVEESMAAYQKKGDLDTYLLLQQAKKDVEGGAAVPAANADGLHAGLVQPVAAYHKLIAAAETDKARRLTTLQTQYLAGLQDQIKKLMKLEKIDEAMKVKEELDRVKAERGSAPEPEKPAAAPAPAPTPAPAPAATTPKEKEKDDYPNIAGSWKEDKGGVFVVSQNGQYWTGKCTYMHPRFGEVKSEIKGSVSKDLQIKGDMRYFKAPTSNMKPHTRTGTVSADGQTITFSFSRPGGDKNAGDADEEVTWTKQTK